MLIGSAIIAVMWLVKMPLWISIVGTVFGAILIEFCCLVFTTRLFRFASSQDIEEITAERERQILVSENKITNKGDITWKKQLQPLD